MSRITLERLAEFIVQLDFDGLPDEAIPVAKHFVAESAATILVATMISSSAARTHIILMADRIEFA